MLFSTPLLGALCLLTFAPGQVLAQNRGTTTARTTTTSSTRTTSTTSGPFASTTSASTIAGGGNAASPTTADGATGSTPPDVYLNVPTLSVGRIELDVDDLTANINLNAQVANLVTLNAGVAVSITKVNLTISEVDAQLELIVRLNNLVAIVQRVFQSLDLNPSLITGIVSNVTSALAPIVGAVDGLLGSITQGGSTLNFLVDNLGNIVQDVNGVSTIVGNYLTNMTATGVTQTLSGGLLSTQYSYSPLNSLVNVVTNTAGQVVQATVQKATNGTST